ncbi:hypothetical protein cypCar_00044099, partial [Cyprinus carpio]
PNPDSEQSSSMWMDDSVSNFSVGSSSSYNDNTEVPRKSRKRTPRQRPGPKPAARDEAGMDVFDADSAKAPHFVLSQLGSDTKVTPKVSSLEVSNNQKGGILSIQYPQKSEGKELKILIQPETQHRARYLTEGSRGSVKDRTQLGFPTIKLEGVTEPVVLQVFVANDAGRVKPHGFYQACRVTGRNTTACKEVDIEGTTVIEVNLEPTNSMTLAVDCVGILKLRNADVEARIGVAGSKKKSTRARLAFRVNIPRADGSVLTLQALSSPILCTQPAGVPEILKKSLHSCSVAGGEEVFIIGKNFLKGTKVIFQENSTEKVELSVKSELPATVKACTFEEQIKAMQTETNCLNNVLMLPMVKREEPMEVSCNAAPSDIFKPVEALSSTQQILEISTVLPSATKSFPSPVALQSVDSQTPSAQIFTTQETLSTIQKQDIPSPTSFQVSLSEDTTVLQPVPPQVPQQFLRETPETLSPEDNSVDGSGIVLVGIDSRNPPSQRPQVQALLPQDGVTQLERAALLFSGQNQASLGSDHLPENIFQEQQPMQVVPSSENVAVVNPSNQPTASAAQPTPNPSIIFPQPSVVSVAQQDSAEPMSFQDQSTVVSDSSASMSSTRTELFQDQQPMQVVPSATTVNPVSPTDQPSVNIFLPQSAISALQGGVSAQELPPTATTATIFSGPSGVAVGGLQNTTTPAPQQPPSQLFQTAIGGTLSQPVQPGQAGLYLFEIPSECGPLMNSPGSSLSDQLVTMGHPGSDQAQFQTSAQIHPLLDQSSNLDDKIDELLERFQEQGKTLPRDFLDH